MRNIIVLALIAGFLTGCNTAPMNEEAWAAQLNSNYRVWPPIVPGQAFPDQIMDGKR